jgi:hypothetical protein
MTRILDILFFKCSLVEIKKRVCALFSQACLQRLKKTFSLFFRMDFAKLKEDVIRQIQKHGIKQLVKLWRPNSIEVHSLDDLQRLVYSYHPHSFIAFPSIPRIHQKGEVELSWEKKLPKMPMPQLSITRNKIGRAKFFHFLEMRPEIYQKAERRMQLMIEKFLPKLRGLILDFRFHTGGNIAPVISALSLILQSATLICEGETKCKRSDSKWMILREDGQIGEGKWTGKVLPNLRIPLAVLFGPNTSSAGEILSAIFSGRPGIRSFGASTSGYLSSNGDQWISPDDKFGLMLITSSLFTTVDGVFHSKERLHPDVRTKTPVSDAQRWIKSQW